MIADRLRAARELIADPEHWTQKRFACNKDGLTVNACSRSATRFCALGAVRRVGMPDEVECEAISRLNSAAAELYLVSMVSVNDKRTHADVLKVYDRAIQLAED